MSDEQYIKYFPLIFYAFILVMSCVELEHRWEFGGIAVGMAFIFHIMTWESWARHCEMRNKQ